MLTSLALIFLLGLFMSKMFEKLRLPSLLGMLLTGIILGPYALNLLDKNILMVSADLRQIALIIILTRAGLSLDIEDLKKVGRPALCMCFIPATFELLAVVLIAPLLFHISVLDAAIMGTVLAAVSPAVIVPRMLKLMKEGYGKEKGIPQLIMAGASVDDIFVIVLFTSFLGVASGEATFSATAFLQVPIAIILGLGLGVLTGYIVVKLFKNLHIRDSAKVIILLSVAFLFITLEKSLEGMIPISGLLAVMALGATVLKQYEIVAKRLSNKFNKLWVAAELLLFVLVGAEVNISYALNTGAIAVVLIGGALVFRALGVYVCLIKTKLNKKERTFCTIAYMPKATVQAAIGALPLSMGLSSGGLILTVAVLAIMITAPIGALGIDLTYKKFLTCDV